MKRVGFFAAAAALSALAGVSFGAPRETFTQAGSTITGTFQSDGSFNGAANGVATFTAVGGYSPKKLIINGSLNSGGIGSWAREGTIHVIPPSGNDFLINAVLGQGNYITVNIPTDFVAAPAGPISDAAGVWTLRFYECWDDGGVDANWSNLSIVLDDADPTFPGADPNAFASNTFIDAESDGPAAGPNPTYTWTYTGASNAAGFAISGFVVGRGGYTVSRDGTSTSEVRVGVTPPGGAEIVVNPMAVIEVGPKAVNGITVSLPAPAAPGLWTVRLFETNGFGEGNGDDPGIDNVWRRLTLSLLPGNPPASTAIAPLTDGAFVTRTATFTATEIKWFSFTIPAIDNFSTALDIDTEGSVVTDTSIGLYRANGQRVAVDFDDGSGEQSQLSFGRGFRNGVAPGNRFNGRDGGTLEAGTYYLAVTPGSAAVFQPGVWGVSNPGPGEAGDITVRVRLFDGTTAIPPTELPDAIDLGTLDGSNSASINLSWNDMRWVKFTITEEASDFTGRFVDIDTTDTPVLGGDPGTGENDTEIAIYDASGFLLATNDDINTAGDVLFSRLSFGQSFPNRPYPLYTGDGSNGTLSGFSYPATFYVAVGLWESTFGTTDFNGIGVDGEPRDGVILTIRNNYPGGPTGCNAADIATAGNPDPQAGPDGFLTGDDFDLFINAFFNELRRTSDNTLIADMVDGDGNPPPDGFLTGSDFDYFLSKFFQGC